MVPEITSSTAQRAWPSGIRTIGHSWTALQTWNDPHWWSKPHHKEWHPCMNCALWSTFQERTDANGQGNIHKFTPLTPTIFMHSSMLRPFFVYPRSSLSKLWGVFLRRVEVQGARRWVHALMYVAIVQQWAEQAWEKCTSYFCIKAFSNSMVEPLVPLIYHHPYTTYPKTRQ